MTRNERLALNELSRQTYGKSSHWEKMLKNGEIKTLTRTLDDGTEEKYKGIHYPTVEEVFNTIKDLKESQEKEAEQKAREELEAEAKKQAAEIKKVAEGEKHDPVKDVMETVES